MIRVVIERRCKSGKELELENMLTDLRIRAMQQHGYISSETLRSVKDPSHWLVISTWLYSDLWKAWEDMPERREITNKIAPLLINPERISFYTFLRR